MGEANDWTLLQDQMHQLANRDEETALKEEERRRLMVEKGNYHKGPRARSWVIGEKVVYNVTGGEATIIGFPSKTAPSEAPGRDGTRGTTWVKLPSGSRLWISEDLLTTKESGTPTSPSRRSPRLEQAALRQQRSSTVQPKSRKRLAEEVIVTTSDEEGDEDATSGASESEAGPSLAAFERNRKPRKKRQPKCAFTSGRNKTKPTGVSLTQRLKEFPNAGLNVCGGSLYCVACKKPMTNLKTSIETHIKSQHHKVNFEKLVLRNDKNTKLADNLEAYFNVHLEEKGTHVVKEMHIVRYRTTEAFLASGTPLERLPYFKDLIETGSYSLSDGKELAAVYVPKIEAEQVNLLKDELSTEFISVQFDGTTRLGEAIVCVARYCTANFKLEKRLIMCKTTAKHVNGRQLATLVTELLCTTLKLNASSVIGMSRDSASVNANACKRLIQNPFFSALDLLCICHTLNNAGSAVSFAVLDQWMTSWLELVGGRNPHRGAQSLWKDTVSPTPVPGYSKVRWHSKAEIAFVLAENFNCLSEFLDELDNLEYGDASRIKLRTLFTEKKSELELELAAMLDMRRLVQQTYSLEGDRLEILLVYRRIQELRQLGVSIKHCDDGCLPTVQALLRSRVKLENGVEIRKNFAGHGTFSAFIISSSRVNSTLYPGTEAIAYQVRYPSDGEREDLEEDELRPLLKTSHLPEFKEMCGTVYAAFDYLEKRLTGECREVYSCVNMYEACRLLQALDPSYASNVDNAFVDDLCALVLLQTHANKQNMKATLPKYKSLAAEWHVDHSSVDTFTEQVLAFWKANRTELAEWAKVAQLAFALAPNSAACERAFSILEVLFGRERDASLADMVQAAMLLRYNKRVCV